MVASRRDLATKDEPDLTFTVSGSLCGMEAKRTGIPCARPLCIQVLGVELGWVGHRDVTTTEIDTHVLQRGGAAV